MARVSIWLASTTILAVSPLYAQETNPVDLGALVLDQGVETDEEVAETITADDIADTGANTASTLFQSVTNVQTSGTSVSGTRIFINGLETNSASVTVDGAPVGSQVWHHGGPGGINPRLFEQVDVYAGITPADIGPFATAGALVFTTIDAADMLDADDDFGGFAGIRYESNGDVMTYEGSVYGRAENFDYLLYLSTADGNNWEDGDGNTVPFTGTGVNSALAKLGYDMGEGRRLAFSTTYYEDKADRNIRSDINFGFGGGLNAIPNKNTTNTYTLEYTDDLVEGFFNPEFRLTHTQEDQFQERRADPATATLSNVDVTTKNTTLKVQNKVAIAGGEVRFGFDYLDASSYNNGNQVGEKMKNTGLFVQANADITDRLRVAGGLRYDWTEFTGQADSGFSRKDDGYSANLYAEYDANHWLTLDAGVSHVFGGYDFGETATLTNAAVYTDGDAETSDNYRVGFNVALPNGFYGGVHAFRTKIEDAGNTRARELAGETLETKGWDADIGYRFQRGVVSLSYTDADVRENGDLLAGYADYSGAPVGQILVLRGSYDFENGLVVGGFVEAALDYDVADQTLPAYQVVNLFASYTPPGNEALNIRLGVDNLFNEQYFSRQSRDADDDFLFAEPGRSVSLSLNYTF